MRDIFYQEETANWNLMPFYQFRYPAVNEIKCEWAKL